MSAVAPCGNAYDTQEDARDHEATCGECAGATESYAAEAFTAPCGASQPDMTKAMRHAATCGLCRTAATVQAIAGRPLPRSLTARRDSARKAREALARFTEAATDAPDEAALRKLGWALAYTEAAVYAQTGGRLGRKYATGATALERLVNQ